MYDKVPKDEKSRNALDKLSGAVGSEGFDVEKPDYLSAAAPNAEASLQQKLQKELRKNWWLWGAVLFAVLLIGSLVVFRNELYSSAGHGMPFLAVKENAAEACATECTAEVEKLIAKDSDEWTEIKKKEQYELCYTKCVALETKEVAEEREKFKQNEEKFEEMVEEKMKDAEASGADDDKKTSKEDHKEGKGKGSDGKD